MTETKRPKRSHGRGLKTWSSLGNLGRRPTDYEIVTHGLNHTARPGCEPLEMGPDVHGNVWLKKHRDGMRLKVTDWDQFRDPDAVTYATYCAGQDDQEIYVEGLLERFDSNNYDADLGTEALDLLMRALAPGRFLGHGLQMLSAYVQQLGVSSYVQQCAVFQTADQLRRVQTTSYRTTQLRLTREGDGSMTAGERWHWESNPDWQPFRKAVELALLEYDWDRAFAVTNLLVKPLTDIITLDALAGQAAAAGAQLDSLILQNLYRDSRRSQRWTGAMVTFVTEAVPANRDLLQEYLDEFAPLAQEILAAAPALIATPAGASAAQITESVRTAYTGLLAPHGLKVPGL